MKNTLIAILLLCSTAICAQTNKDFQEIDNYFKAIRTAPESIDIDKMESFTNSLPQPFPKEKYFEQCRLYYLRGIIELEKYNNIYEARKNFEKYLELYYIYDAYDGVLGVAYTRDMRMLAQLLESHDYIIEAIMYAYRAVIVNATISWARDISSEYIKELSALSEIRYRLFCAMQSRTEGSQSEGWAQKSKETLEFSQKLSEATPIPIDDENKKMILAVGPNKSYTAPNYLEADKDSLPFTYEEIERADKLFNEISNYVNSGNYDLNLIRPKLSEAADLYRGMSPYRYHEFFTVYAALLSGYLSTAGGEAEAFLKVTEQGIIPYDYEAMNLPSYRNFIGAISATVSIVGEADYYLNECQPVEQWIDEERLNFSSNYFNSLHTRSLYTAHPLHRAEELLAINDFAFWRGHYDFFNNCKIFDEKILEEAGLKFPDYLSTDHTPTSSNADNNTPADAQNMSNHLSKFPEYLLTRQFDKAESCISQIIEIKDKYLIPDIVMIQLQSIYAFIMYNNGNERYLEATQNSNQSIADIIKKTFVTLPSGTSTKIFSQYKDAITMNNNLLWLNRSSKAAEYLYNSALFTKGLQLRTSTLIQDAILSSGDTAVINRYNEINHLYQIYYTLDDSTLNNLDLWRMELNLLQKVPFDNTFDEKMQKKWTEVKKALKEDEAAIEFMRIPYWKNIEEYIDSKKQSTDYCALLLRNNSNHPEIIPLCSEEYLQSLLTRKVFKDAIHYNNIYSNNKKRDCRGDELYNALWVPIEKHLQGVSTIYYSTDGVLHSLALHAMHDSAKVCLSDRYAMNLLSSTGDIQEFKSRKSRKPASAVVYGGAQFSVENGDELVAATEKYNIRQQGDELFAELQRSDSEGSWPYLPGTLAEAEYVKKKMDSIRVPARLLTGIEANEESFKAMDRNAPQLLHVATHGFYISTQESDQISNFMDFLASAHNLDSVADAQSRSDAMLRSGLIFAGGNRAWSNREAIDGVEDGILTSSEISSLNLSSTKLLVLAACQSGLGEANDHEGVFGLQRAFKLAGVETIIMTLWRVPDDTTAKLIQLFYDNWTAGMEKHAAFKKAQQQIRAENPNPYYWGAFVILD